MNNESLKTLHTALVDARKGYLEAAKDAGKPEMKSLFQSMIALHEVSHGDVHGILERRGEKVTDGGSFMSTVHESVIAVRSAVAGLDHGSLSSFASGEDQIVKDYDEAIRDNSDDASVVATLTRQKTELEKKIGEMRRLAKI